MKNIERTGQESVWDYPRPPKAEQSSKHICIEFGGKVIADTTRAVRILETSHPPVYYIPPDDVDTKYLIPSQGNNTFCEWKGEAQYHSVAAGEKKADRAAWSYAHPNPAYAGIKNHIAFYASKMDSCTVDGEHVRPQEGEFYGGWITKDIVGPFKGSHGTTGW